MKKSLKRLIAVIFFIICSILVIRLRSVDVYADEEYKYYKPYPDATYELKYHIQDDNTICIDSVCGGNDTGYIIIIGSNMLIPDSIDGINVVAIGNKAFQRCNIDGTLTISDNVESIGNGAFEHCSFTNELKLPSHLKSIGTGAFSYCRCGHHCHLVIPSGVTIIEEYAFYNFNCAHWELTIPDGVITIGKSAFAYGSGASSGISGNIILPDSLISIGDCAFENCSSLTGDLVVPSSVNSIGDSAFRGCRGFNKIIISDGVKTIGTWAFNGCSGFEGDLLIPSSVESVGFAAFTGCSGLNGTITIPSNITSIDKDDFQGLYKVKKIMNESSFSIALSEVDNKEWRNSVTGEIITEIANGTAIRSDYEEDPADPAPTDPDPTNPTVPLDDTQDRELSFGKMGFPIKFKWSLSKLIKSKPSVDEELAKMSLILSNKAYSENTSALISALKELDLAEEGENMYVTHHDSFVIPHHTFALKEYTYNGKTYNIITIVIRGSYEFEDWFNNIGSYGFVYATDAVYSNLEDFLSKKGIGVSDKNNRYLITGHSLGGAVANLLQYYIIMNSMYNDGAVFADSITCYTYASPFTFWHYNRGSSGFGYSMNFVHPDDPVSVASNDYIMCVTDVLERINDYNLLRYLAEGLQLYKAKDYMPMRYGYDIDMGNISDSIKNMYTSYSGVVIDQLLNPADRVIEKHSCEMYMALIQECIKNNTLREKFGTASLNSGHVLSLYCPVDIDIVEKTTGNTMASIENNEVVLNNSEDIQMLVMGDQKFVKLPSDNDYIIRIEGNADGKMDYVIQDIASDSRGLYLTNAKRFDNVSLKDEKTMESTILKDGNNATIKLLVLSEDNTPIKEVNEDGTESNVTENNNEPEQPLDTSVIGQTEGGRALTISKEDKDGSTNSNSSGRSSYYSTRPIVNEYPLMGVFIVNGTGLISGNVKLGKQVQGSIAQLVFKLFLPRGWKEAFTFNMTVNDKADYSLKNGTMAFSIPTEYRKAGRRYAIMGIDRNGQVQMFADLDNFSDTLTTNINLEGYAFDLIYADL